MPIIPESGQKIASLPNSRVSLRPSATQENASLLFITAFGLGPSSNGNVAGGLFDNSSYLTMRNVGGTNIWYSYTDYPSLELSQRGNLIQPGERHQLGLSFPVRVNIYITSVAGGLLQIANGIG